MGHLGDLPDGHSIDCLLSAARIGKRRHDSKPAECAHDHPANQHRGVFPAGRQPPSTSRSLPLFAAISGIVPLALWGSKELRKGSRRRWFAVHFAGKSALAYSAFLVVLALWLVGCGANSYSANSNAPSTPPGTYQLPVVATARRRSTVRQSYRSSPVTYRACHRAADGQGAVFA
jgi:hypothetical protein